LGGIDDAAVGAALDTLQAVEVPPENLEEVPGTAA
jgi:hypothetical protein